MNQTIKIGDTVRLTGKYLSNTGRRSGRVWGQSRWRVTAINSDWAVTNQPVEFGLYTPEELAIDPTLGFRRIALANLEVVKGNNNR